MGKFFEAGMVICFGISWPISVLKSWRARTAKGKSVVFVLLILLGYILAMIGKILTHNINYVFVFYVINCMMVCVDLLLYVRNCRLDRAADSAGRA